MSAQPMSSVSDATAGSAVRVARDGAVSPTAQRHGLVARLKRRVGVGDDYDELVIGIVLAVGLIAVGILMYAMPRTVPWAFVVPFVVLSGALHGPQWHAGILALAVGEIALLGATIGDQKPDAAGAAVALCIVGFVTFWRCMSRARVGVQGTRGESMLADLRDRLLRHGRVPELPAPWRLQTCVQPAYAQQFSGDFLLARRSGESLELALVDVSGKGLDAGTRALILASAFEALLGAVPQEEFLAAANDYVVRQDWTEGFASAVYACVDLETGDYLLSAAGHPPAIGFVDGRWAPLTGATGPVLGLLDGVTYPYVRGTLETRDALVLYTDGLIEGDSLGVDEGIERLVGEFRTWTVDGFEGIAQHVCAVAPGGQSDDCGVVVLWRE